MLYLKAQALKGRPGRRLYSAWRPAVMAPTAGWKKAAVDRTAAF